MASYLIKELLLRWETERFTTEQIIGHILQHLQTHEKRLLKLEATDSKLQKPEPSKQ